MSVSFVPTSGPLTGNTPITIADGSALAAGDQLIYAPGNISVVNNDTDQRTITLKRVSAGPVTAILAVRDLAPGTTWTNEMGCGVTQAGAETLTLESDAAATTTEPDFNTLGLNNPA